MEIAECLLSEDNRCPLGNATLGERVRAGGADRLWELRPRPVDTVVVHYISAVDIEPSRPYDRDLILGIFCTYGVSSHYLVERDGAVMRLVPESAKAWHCGGSVMPEPDERTGVNDFSIGIELVATHDSGFTDAQYGALVHLCGDIGARWTSPLRIVGHEHIAGCRAVARGLREEAKCDPGPRFDWGRFAAGLVPAGRSVGEGLIWDV
ncbi:MAG: hypothetical protein GF331_09935, partial [Chitinivibrionales bacterium]|nr:hypothetical protein [Chitinivibrionales bacterium]